MVHDQLHRLYAKEFVILTLCEGLDELKPTLVNLMELWQVDYLELCGKLGAFLLEEPF